MPSSRLPVVLILLAPFLLGSSLASAEPAAGDVVESSTGRAPLAADAPLEPVEAAETEVAAPMVAVEPPGLAEALLGPSVNEHPETRAKGPIPTDEEAADREAEATKAFYSSIYRPANNPGRFTLVGRLTYSVLASQDRAVNGRLGGASVDLGQSWNRIGYALTVTAFVGDLRLQEDFSVRSSGMFGGGPTLDLGRLALLQYGFADLRVGYDFYYVPTRANDPGATKPSAVAPHGPRVIIEVGLLASLARQRRFFHGVGLVVGYQPLIGSLTGGLPFTNSLIFGFNYWMG
ncbi:MAG: hypothetical protein IPK80_31660 [Nannocystis sp.]|nr:hypothetical protein [Nannocystis sp.]